MRTLSLCVAIGLTASVSGLGQVEEANAASIKSALATAYNENPELNAQRAATRAADEALPQAKAGFRPTIIGNADYGHTRTVTKTAFRTTGTTLNPYGFGVTISQSLFAGFRNIRSVEAAKSSIYASRETLRNVEQNTLFNAASAYADVIQAQQILDIRRRNIGFLAEQLRASQARLDVGEGTRTDVAQSQARLALARAQLSAAQATLAAAAGTYRQIIGKDPRSLTPPKGPRRLYASSLQQAISIANREHPAIKATQHLVDVALFNVKIAESALLPSVTVEGALNRRFNASGPDTRTDSASVTARLRVPIYQGGSEYSTIRQNKQTLGQRRIEVDQTRDQVRNAVVSAWTQLQAANANLSANEAQVRAARLALSGVIEERKVGQRTTLEVLDAQSDVLSAQELQVQSRRNIVVAGYALVSAMGRLNSSRLRLKVAHYSPKRHYEEVKDKWFGLRTPNGR
ncbi:MAG: TolC family outer membrane protein [Pseudomonadota bacterium]